MPESFAKIRSLAEEAERRVEPDQAAALRELRLQQRKALSLFTGMKTNAGNARGRRIAHQSPPTARLRTPTVGYVNDMAF